jgi:hypothetical protein
MTCVYVYRCSGAASPGAAASDDSTDRYHLSCSTIGAGIADASIRTMYGFRSPPSAACDTTASKSLVITPNNDMADRDIG